MLCVQVAAFIKLEHSDIDPNVYTLFAFSTVFSVLQTYYSATLSDKLC